MKPNVLVADTDLLFANGIAAVVQQNSQLEWAGIVRAQDALQSALKHLEPGVAMVALSLVNDLPQLASELQAHRFRLLLILDPQQEPPWEFLPRIDGVVMRNAAADKLAACLLAVAAGGTCTPAGSDIRIEPVTAGERILAELSPRQIQIMRDVARGEKNAAIAERLQTSEQVVKNLLRGIYDQTGVSDRLELALYVLHHPELAVSMHSLRHSHVR